MKELTKEIKKTFEKLIFSIKKQSVHMIEVSNNMQKASEKLNLWSKKNQH